MKPKPITLKLAATLYTRNTAPGRVRQYRAATQDVTGSAADTPALALAALAALVEARSRFESAHVRVLILRGHVGIFSTALDGSTVTQHVAPGRADGEVYSSSHGQGTIATAIASFRYHVAQLTWDGRSYGSELLTAPEHTREFRSWVGFQLAYRYAVDALHKADRDAHRYASEHPFSEPEAVEPAARYFDASRAPLRSLVAPAA